jgi:hypothetical protein
VNALPNLARMIDHRTGRPFGDNGSEKQARKYGDSIGIPETFLKAWREGTVLNEYPEYGDWLIEQGAAK